LTGDDIDLAACSTAIQILPSGPATKMLTYGTLDANGVCQGSFPGPTIRHASGSPLRLHLRNDLDEAITLHHHGNHSASADDGQPADGADKYLIQPGGTRTYTYGLSEAGAPERPAFQWYHDHLMDMTSEHVWMGLAGMVILDPAPGDPEADLPLPSGDRDVPIMLTDRSFDANNQIGYTFDANGVLASCTATTSCAILANGAPNPYFAVEARKYRIRLLNASNARPYLLSMSNGMPMTQIATESGLLPYPVDRSQIRLDPAERVEVVLDFAPYAGQSLVLKNGLGFGPTLSQVLQFRVGTTVTNDPAVPPTLRAIPGYGDALTPLVEQRKDEQGRDEIHPTVTRLWLLTQTGVDSPDWTINGLGYDPARVDAEPHLGDIEKWIFVNTTSVDHVMHIHDVDWRVMLRAGSLDAPGVECGNLPADPTGLVPPEAPPAAVPACPEELKESFRVRPFEVVEVTARFTDHVGVYVFHCHILEHEDHAMMSQFEVVSSPLPSGS
jgi:spore coat protein A